MEGEGRVGAILDIRRALLDLLNVIPVTVERWDDPEIHQGAERFLVAYGPLRSDMSNKHRVAFRKGFMEASDRLAEFNEPAEVKRIMKGELERLAQSNLHAAFFGPPDTPPQTVTFWANTFGWAILYPREAQARAALNLILSSVFTDSVIIDGTVHPTALNVDFVGGTIEPRPRDLLDALALELLRSAKLISRCALCSKFFYRTFNKDKYCSTVCGSEARRKAQLEWVRAKRAEDGKKKSRKTRRKA
jgi:hypothetical protein